MKGYFTVAENPDELFDIHCEIRPDVTDTVPEEQRKLYEEVESACNVIKSLNSTDEDTKRKYFNKLLSLAQVGLVPENAAQPEMARSSLEKLKAEILLIEGKRIKNHYMTRLGIFAVGLVILVWSSTVVLCNFVDTSVCDMVKFTWLGAMVGAWVSYGARKFQFEFEDMSTIEKDMLGPIIRLIYIGICSLIFELFLSCGIATINIGDITTVNLQTSHKLQLLIGVICGAVESKVGIDIYKRANSVIVVDEK